MLDKTGTVTTGEMTVHDVVAADGESTRRAIPSIGYGYDFAAGHDIPAYDAGVVPYPSRMREYGARAARRR